MQHQQQESVAHGLAKSLHKSLKAQGVPVKLNQIQEAIASAAGARHWNVLKAMLAGVSQKPSQATDNAPKDLREHPVIRQVLARIAAAHRAVEAGCPNATFRTSLQHRSEANKVYHDHDGQRVSAFLAPIVEVGDWDEEALPAYPVRFADGTVIQAFDDEIKGDDARLEQYVNAVSGAFACARRLGFAGIWHLAAEGTKEQCEQFLKAYAVFGRPEDEGAVAHPYLTIDVIEEMAREKGLAFDQVVLQINGDSPVKPVDDQGRQARVITFHHDGFGRETRYLAGGKVVLLGDGSDEPLDEVDAIEAGILIARGFRKGRTSTGLDWVISHG